MAAVEPAPAATRDHSATAGRERSPLPDRDPLLDNARLVLICCVVTAHVIRLNLYDVGWTRAIYAWMFIFMMPAFAAIAGHLSRTTLSLRNVKVLARRLLAPYLVFELLYAGAHVVAGRREQLIVDLLTPTWVLWFLAALFLWRLSLPVLVKTGHPLLVSTVIGLCGGLLPAPVYALSLTRALVLYPFFVLGHVGARHQVSRLKAHPVGNATVLAVAAVVAFVFFRGGGEAWLHGTQPYTEMGVSPLLGVPLRLGYYLAVAVVVASFLACVPDRRARLTDLGGRSLYPYLLHGVVLLTLERFVSVPYSPPVAVAALTAGVLLALALATRPVVRVARVVVDPVSTIGALAGRLRGRRP